MILNRNIIYKIGKWQEYNAIQILGSKINAIFDVENVILNKNKLKLEVKDKQQEHYSFIFTFLNNYYAKKCLKQLIKGEKGDGDINN